MSLLPEVETVVMDAVRRDRRARARGGVVAAIRRGLRSHPRALIVVLAALVVAGPAVAAVTLLQSGTSVGPDVPPTPGVFDGVAIRSSIELLPLRTADPAGGPPWGMRIERTTRGLVCVQVGRIAFGTLGALGRDGAFENDGRFHPFSPDYLTGPPCSVPDAHGNAFINVAWWGEPASALTQGYGQRSCTPARTAPPEEPPALKRRIEHLRTGAPTCPTVDLRNVYYGLLGPDAVSITHLTPSGKLATTPTGPDGAYIIVMPGAASYQNNGFTYNTRLVPGPIRAVHYRDGHTCRLQRCPPIGYVPAARRLPTPAQVATPVSARVERTNAKAWCVRLSPPRVPQPCRGRTPPGFQRLGSGRSQELVVISWISRIAVKNGHSSYYYTFTPPHVSGNPNKETSACGASGQLGGQTRADYKAGERVTASFFERPTCHGIGHGNVTLVITTGPNTPAGPMPTIRGQSVGREVGHFTVTMP